MTLLYKTNEDTPPPFSGVAYFERSCDPFHPKKIQEALGAKVDSSDVKESGWMAIDWYENPIGFIPDGTGTKFPKPEFELAQGYFNDGRMFAYPKNEHLSELKARHEKERIKREEQ